MRLCGLQAPLLTSAALGLSCVLAPAGGLALTREAKSPFALQFRARNVLTLAAVREAGRDAVTRLAAVAACVLVAYAAPLVATDASLRAQVGGWLARSKTDGAG